jgi:hypothetical protein
LPEGTDLAHIRGLYLATKAVVDGDAVGFYTEKRYRFFLHLYAQALIETGELPSRETERLAASVEAVTAAEAVAWSPTAVERVDAAYANLRQLLDTLVSLTSLGSDSR